MTSAQSSPTEIAKTIFEYSCKLCQLLISYSVSKGKEPYLDCWLQVIHLIYEASNIRTVSRSESTDSQQHSGQESVWSFERYRLVPAQFSALELPVSLPPIVSEDHDDAVMSRGDADGHLISVDPRVQAKYAKLIDKYLKSDQKARSFGVNEIMKNIKLKAEFREFAVKNYMIDEFLFWEDVQEFKENPSFENWSKIMTEYVSESGSRSLGLSGQTRVSLMRARDALMSKEPQVTVRLDFYDELIPTVQRTLHRNMLEFTLSRAEVSPLQDFPKFSQDLIHRVHVEHRGVYDGKFLLEIQFEVEDKLGALLQTFSLLHPLLYNPDILSRDQRDHTFTFVSLHEKNKARGSLKRRGVGRSGSSSFLALKPDSAARNCLVLYRGAGKLLIYESRKREKLKLEFKLAGIGIIDAKNISLTIKITGKKGEYVLNFKTELERKSWGSKIQQAISLSQNNAEYVKLLQTSVLGKSISRQNSRGAHPSRTLLRQLTSVIYTSSEDGNRDDLFGYARSRAAAPSPRTLREQRKFNLSASLPFINFSEDSESQKGQTESIFLSAVPESSSDEGEEGQPPMESDIVSDTGEEVQHRTTISEQSDSPAGSIGKSPSHTTDSSCGYSMHAAPQGLPPRLAAMMSGDDRNMAMHQNVNDTTMLISSSSSEDDEDDEILGSSNGNFTAQFANCLASLRETMKMGLPCTSQYISLIRLEEDFITNAMHYGKTIINERFLKEGDRIVKTANVGGSLGGDKYIVGGILFKFAVDSSGIFRGGAEQAMKVAGHELKGLRAYVSLEDPNLRYPLMAIVDYRGFRLVASSLLPLGPNSLKYGTCDGGATVHMKDPVLNTYVKNASEALGLKAHLIKGGAMISSPIDLEGHIGTDGHYYLLDFSRVLPPVTPAASRPGSHLYQLFRPEFVSRHSLFPLCSDSYSSFVKGMEDEGEHRSETDAATQHLLGTVINAFIPDLVQTLEEEMDASGTLGSINLGEELHLSGINIRYLGEIVRRINPTSRVVPYLIAQMCARVIKVQLRAHLRETAFKLRSLVTVAFRIAVTKHLNLVFSSGENSSQHWRTKIKEGLAAKYNLSPSTWKAFPVNLKEYLWGVSVDLRLYIFNEVREAMALEFHPMLIKTLQKYSDVWKQNPILSDTDLIDIGVRVKHLDIMNQAKAEIYSLRGGEKEQAGFLPTARLFHRKALDAFQRALAHNALDAELYLSCAMTSMRIAALDHELNGRRLTRGGRMKELILEAPLMKRANRMFLRAISCAERQRLSTAHMHRKYAQFSVVVGELEKAEIHFLTALDKCPCDKDILSLYIEFMENTHVSKDIIIAFAERRNKCF